MKVNCETTVNPKRAFNTKNIAKIGVLSALAALLMLLEFPLFFAPFFYKLDFSEVMVLLGAFSMGPVAGIIIEAIKILLNFAFDGTTTAGVGELANFIIGCSFIVPAAVIYQRNKTKKGAIVGMIAGTISMAIIGAVMNYYVIIPAYSIIMPLDKIIALGTEVNPAIVSLESLILLATTPFNLLKGVLTSIIAFLLYKRVSSLLHS
ncbi:MAG: ECF transporter S component [Thermoclostridium sp.]|nr:ECF transporter S component [Thermoclostridium sp.]